MNPTAHLRDTTTNDQDTQATGARVHDRRTLLSRIALGGAGAAVGAALVSTDTVRAFGGSFVGQATPAPTGTTFFPISPERAYDSRQPNYAENSPLAPNTDRLVSIADGHSADGTVTAENIVPEGATAALINLTAAAMTAGNYLSVTSGDVTSTATSVVNWPDDATQVANSITVPIDADRQVRVYCGDQAGSTDFIVDVFGYYVPVEQTDPTPTTTTTTTVAPG